MTAKKSSRMPQKVLAPKVGVKGAERRAQALRGVRLPVSLPKGSLSKKGPPRGKSKFGLVP